MPMANWNCKFSLALAVMKSFNFFTKLMHFQLLHIQFNRQIASAFSITFYWLNMSNEQFKSFNCVYKLNAIIDGAGENHLQAIIKNRSWIIVFFPLKWICARSTNESIKILLFVHVKQNFISDLFFSLCLMNI